MLNFQDLLLKNWFLLLTLHDSRVLVVWGMEGVGKKIMVQKVGKYLFERKYFTEVKYIEQGSVISEEEIKAQINEKDINTGNPNDSLNKIPRFPANDLPETVEFLKVA